MANCNVDSICVSINSDKNEFLCIVVVVVVKVVLDFLHLVTP